VSQGYLVDGGPQLDDAFQLRDAVFVHEQGVAAELERDGRDDAAQHAVVVVGGRVVATARMLVEGTGDDAVAIVGRVAVAIAERGGGHGVAVMQVLEHRASELGLPIVELHAQVAVEGFYDRLGYVPVGDRYLEAGIEHVTMRKELLPGLRPVRDEDGPALERLIAGCWSEYPGCVMDVDNEEPWLRAPATAYAEKQGVLWVVGDVTACIGMRPLAPGTVELKSLYVSAPARRGGLGGRLVRRGERWAHEQGAGRIELWSDTRFLDAHRLYERLGYVRTGRTRDLHDLSNTTEFFFVKELG
jgi:predicted GNAT family N-acyltransferase/RimJ/RimL family protein N-acetyltransferase